jgi:ERCC4-related helicase
MFENTIEVEKKKEKSSMDIKRRYWFHFERIECKQHHLLYQLPTGGGKTVVFSEIVRRYLSKSDKKVVVDTQNWAV